MVDRGQNNCTTTPHWLDGKLPIVITNCTHRKRLQPTSETRLSSIESSSVEVWASRVKATPTRLPVREMYCGRGFREALRAADSLTVDLWVASAGLGFVRADADIPPYGATAAPGQPDSIAGNTAAWFAALLDKGPFPGAPRLTSAPIVLAALSSPYLTMLTPWLEAIEEEAPGRLRIFTWAKASPCSNALSHVVMPYDRRLDDAALARAGTIGDFAQRALRDFVETVLPADPKGSAQSHAAAVLRRLDGYTAPVRRLGRGVTDDEVQALIREHWHAAGGRSGRMLRVLRDELGIACEQSRFKNLFIEVATEADL